MRCTCSLAHIFDTTRELSSTSIRKSKSSLPRTYEDKWFRCTRCTKSQRILDGYVVPASAAALTQTQLATNCQARSSVCLWDLSYFWKIYVDQTVYPSAHDNITMLGIWTNRHYFSTSDFQSYENYFTSPQPWLRREYFLSTVMFVCSWSFLLLLAMQDPIHWDMESLQDACSYRYLSS
jgi:hypothetical protein